MTFTAEQLTKIEKNVQDYLEAQDIDAMIAKELAYNSTFEACHPSNLVGDETLEEVEEGAKDYALELYQVN